jgi:periplasmic protein TonB
MSAATSQPIPEFYTWGFSGAPIQIQLNLDVVRGIRKQIQDSEKAPGLLSAYGLLTGNTSKPGITRILDFKSLKTLDAASIEAATRNSSVEVIGYYRTTPIGTVSMPDEDRALAVSLFCQPKSVFLVVETGHSSIGDARFCFWGEGELFDWPVMPFPFDAEELAIHERRRLSRIVRKTPQGAHVGLAPVTSLLDETADVSLEPEPGTPPAETKPVAAALEPVAKRRTGAGMGWLVAALATLLAASVISGAFLYYRNGKLPAASPGAPARAEVQASLGLAVERRGNDLVVSWNRNAAMIAKADFGMLLIRGSDVSRDIPLTAEELRSGSVVYASTAEQVRFQLNVVAGEQVAREFLALVLPQAQLPVAVRPATVVSSPGGNARAGVPPRPVVLNVPAPAAELRQFKPVENPQSATVTPPRIDEPPAVAGAASVSGETLPLLSRPVVTMAAPVEAPATQKNPSEETPTIATAAHPPVPTHQTVPALPTALRGAIWKATVVDVNVSVDATGNVVKAEAVAKAALNPLLRDAAVQAARRWKFQPAQFDGHAVPANIVVQFNFAGSR